MKKWWQSKTFWLFAPVFVALLFGAIFLKGRRIVKTFSGSYPLDVSFSDLVWHLDHADDDADKRKNDNGISLTVSSKDSLIYNRATKTLTYTDGGLHWIEFFVSQNELRAVAKRQINPANFPNLRDSQARLYARWKIAFCVVSLCVFVFFVAWRLKNNARKRAN